MVLSTEKTKTSMIPEKAPTKDATAPSSFTPYIKYRKLEFKVWDRVINIFLSLSAINCSPKIPQRIASTKLVFPMEFFPLIKKKPSLKYPSEGIEILSKALKFRASIFNIFIMKPLILLELQEKI